MRLRIGLLSVLIFASAAGPAGAADVSDLMTVDQATALNDETPTYVEKLEVILQEHGQACNGISHINAFSTASGLRTAVACNSGSKRYEIVFEGDSVAVTSAN